MNNLSAKDLEEFLQNAKKNYTDKEWAKLPVVVATDDEVNSVRVIWSAHCYDELEGDI